MIKPFTMEILHHIPEKILSYVRLSNYGVKVNSFFQNFPRNWGILLKSYKICDIIKKTNMAGKQIRSKDPIVDNSVIDHM